MAYVVRWSVARARLLDAIEISLVAIVIGIAVALQGAVDTAVLRRIWRCVDHFAVKLAFRIVHAVQV